MPTNTWQAYNFDDSDGDGWGDTWYAGGNPPVRLNRPYRQRGTPPWFRRSDVPFLKFLRQTGKDAGRARRRRPRGASRAATSCDGSTTSSSSRATRSTSPSTPTTSSSGSATSAAASSSSRRTTSSGRWRRTGSGCGGSSSGATSAGPSRRSSASQYRANDNGTKQGVYNVLDTAGAPVALRGDGPRQRQHARRHGGRLRDRDRLDDAVLAAGDEGAGADPEPLRAGAERRDDLLRDASRERASSRPAHSTSAARSRSSRSGGCSTTSGVT